MNRAAVLIGVDRSGGLPPLKDAARGARKMADWACEQGMNKVEVMTDEGGSTVDIGAVKKAIKRIVDTGTVEQLIVYFAGHGVNINYGERWLLSDAPTDTQAAVNVPGSAVLARYGGIPYVVMISDACRTAAEGIRAQFVTGSEIFPNEGVSGEETPVDQFFACLLGRAAHEIKNGKTTAREYTAVYTESLLSAFEGGVIDEQGYVRPRPLKKYLKDEVARRIRDRNLKTKLIQEPDAHIASDELAWISRRVAGGGGPPPAAAPEPPPPPPPPPPASVGPEPTVPVPAAAPPSMLASHLLTPILAGDLATFNHALRTTRGVGSPRAADIAKTVELTSSPFGPSHYETRSGFKIRGARIARAFSPRMKVEHLGSEAVRVHNPPRPGASVLLVFEDGRGVSLPAIPEFLAALTVEGGELVDVAYEPSDNSRRWHEFARRLAEVRALRAVASSSTRNGVFRLDGDDALTVARRMQYSKGVDPALAIYAAYAYQDLGRGDLIREMAQYMGNDLGAHFFDIALLGRVLDGRTAGRSRRVLSFVPLLAQGWALLSAHRVRLAPSLKGIEHHVTPSVWTLFDPGGVEQLHRALAENEVR